MYFSILQFKQICNNQLDYEFNKQINFLYNIDHSYNSSNIDLLYERCDNFYNKTLKNLQNYDNLLFNDDSCNKIEISEVNDIIYGGINDILNLYSNDVQNRIDYDIEFVNMVFNEIKELPKLELDLSNIIPSILYLYRT